MLLQLMLSEYGSVAVALSQLDDWHTAAVPLVTLIESLPRHRLDVIEAFLSSTQQGITGINTVMIIALILHNVLPFEAKIMSDFWIQTLC